MGILSSLGRALGRPKAGVKKLFKENVVSPTGAPLHGTVTPAQNRALEAADVRVRRTGLGDLLGEEGRLKPMAETGRSGGYTPRDPADIAAEKKERLLLENSLFQGNPTYGYLSAYPPEKALETPFGLRTFGIAKDEWGYLPDDELYRIEGAFPSTYGRFELQFNPDVRKRMTYTLDDSEYRSRGGDILAGIRGSRWEDILRRHVAPDDLETVARVEPERFASLLKEYKVEGLPGEYRGRETGRVPSLYPRVIGSRTPPLSAREKFALEDLPSRLLPASHTNLVEAQLHGPVTRDDVTRVYDFGLKPSRDVERRLKKIGIDYAPMVPKDAALHEYYRAGEKAGMQPGWADAEDLRKIAERRGDTSLLNELIERFGADSDFTGPLSSPFGVQIIPNYNHGGLTST